VRVIQVNENSDIKNCYPILVPKKYYAKVQVPNNSSLGSESTREKPLTTETRRSNGVGRCWGEGKDATLRLKSSLQPLV
jgi:hypothetical protein